MQYDQYRPTNKNSHNTFGAKTVFPFFLESRLRPAVRAVHGRDLTMYDTHSFAARWTDERVAVERQEGG